MVYVIKINGEKAPFDKEKVMRTCQRAGVSKENARKIADEVKSKIYDGITTKEILKMVLKLLEEEHPKHSSKYQLREAISKLDPEEHEFEKYISKLFRAHGYNTQWNKIIQGECIEHQIDVIVEKNGKKWLVECKHRINPHRMCGLGTVLTTWAVIDDIRKATENGIIKENYENLWLIVNTKFSEHAVRYAKAKNILLMGWNYPDEGSLRNMIEDKKMEPVTILNIKPSVQDRLSRAGILLLKELIEMPSDELQRKTGIKRNTLKSLVAQAIEIINKT